MVQVAPDVIAPPTLQFRMVYRYKDRQCEVTFTNEDPIARGTPAELYKIFVTWAKISTHQKVANNDLKKRVVKAMTGSEKDHKWLRARLAAYFVKNHNCSEGKSNTLIVEDLQGKRLEQYVSALPNTSDTWCVKKLGCLTFQTPERVKAV